MAVERLPAFGSPPAGESWHLLSVSEVAEACRLSEKAVRRAIDAGELPAVKLRSRLRIVPQDLSDWIVASRRTNAAVPPVRQARPRSRPATGTFRAMAQRDNDRGIGL